MIDKQHRRAAAKVFLITWLVHSLSLPFFSNDTVFALPTALSIIHEGNTDLNEYLERFDVESHYALECVSPGKGSFYGSQHVEVCRAGKAYNAYPLGASLMAVPVVAVMEAAVWAAKPLSRELMPEQTHPVIRAFLIGDFIGGHPIAQMLVAAFFGACAALLLYLLMIEWTTPRAAFWLALLFAFGTSMWSTGTRALWQHGPSVLVILAAVHLALRCGDSWRMALALGAVAGFSAIVRPTNAVAVATFGLYMLFHRRRGVVAFSAGAAAMLLLLFAYHLETRGDYLSLYYQHKPLREAPAVWFKHAAMHLVSPSRGLFVFTPVALFSLAGMALALWRRWLFPLAPYLMGYMALLYISFAGWFPGDCYGPRFFTDMAALLVVFLIPAIEWWRDCEGGGRRVMAGVFLAAAAWGVFTHGVGAYSIAANSWSQKPVTVSIRPDRVWEWSDPQFLRILPSSTPRR